MSSGGQVEVARLFDSFSENYEAFSDLVSLGMFSRMRGKMVSGIEIQEGARALDLATGTGEDVRALTRRAAALGRSVEALGIDMSRGMVHHVDESVPVVLSTAEQIPFDDDSFDFVVSSYTLRHFHLDAVFSEVRRVLRPGGTVHLLDIKMPENFLAKPLFSLYFSRVVPFLAGLLEGEDEREAYGYFWRSIAASPNTEVAEKLERAGFEDVDVESHMADSALVATARCPRR